MKTSFTPPKSTGAFSLVELLVVIAVIAIVAAVAIPSMINVSERTSYAKNRRNAQTVAAIAASAKAAGVTNDLSGTNAVADLQPPGVSVDVSGRLLSFSVSAMTPEDQAGAAGNLEPSGDVTVAVKLKE